MENKKTGAHTPGPWDYVCGYVTTKDERRDICRIIPDTAKRYGATATANARLIAAAPELLAAMEALVNARRRGDLDITEWAGVETAIAKAKGER